MLVIHPKDRTTSVLSWHQWVWWSGSISQSSDIRWEIKSCNEGFVDAYWYGCGRYSWGSWCNESLFLYDSVWCSITGWCIPESSWWVLQRTIWFEDVELYVEKIWKRIILQPHVMDMSWRICTIQRPIRWIYVQMGFILHSPGKVYWVSIIRLLISQNRHKRKNKR